MSVRLGRRVSAAVRVGRHAPLLSDETERPVIVSAATRRIARLKLLTAVLLVLGLAAVLSLYAFLIARADARLELETVDRLLERRVADVVRALAVAGDGTLVADSGAAADLDGGYPEIHVVEVAIGSARIVSSPVEPDWPDVDVVAAARDATADGSQGTSTYTVPLDSSGPLDRVRVLAAPVYDSEGEQRGAVVAVADITAGEVSHGRLVSFMWWLAVPLIGVSVLVSALLSRGRWWVADVVLERHEQFIRYTAHELRGKLGALRTVVDAGLAGAEPPERALGRVATIVNATDETIHDILTLSEVETGREPLLAEPVRLDALVASLVEARSLDPPIRFESRASVVDANVELVRRAVDNLLDNAVRHGRALDPRADITLTVGDGYVEVADRGPGVRPQVLTHLLERAAANGRQASAGGLGLTIVAWVARVHHGELRAANRPGGGAVFTLVLPRADDANPERRVGLRIAGGE